MSSLKEQFKLFPKYQTLNEDQVKFFDLLFKGESVLLTGPGGAGKSHCINVLREFDTDNKLKIARTSSTGISALTIQGSTINSFAGLGLADENFTNLIKNVKRNKKACSRILNCKALMIDEISMVSAALFDKIDLVFKYIRMNNRTFGGIQLILLGDFLQLPYVSKGNFNEVTGFAFESRAWREANIKVCNLTKLMRQDDKSNFGKVLNEIRFGDTTNLQVILDRQDKVCKDPIQPINLFPINIQVDTYNKTRLDALPGTSFFFHATEFGTPYQLESLNKSCLAPKDLELKIGAQVMLLSNVDTEGGWTNGTICKVLKVEANVPTVQRADGQQLIVPKQNWDIKEAEILPNGDIHYKVVASRSQIPLRVAYATTIHKSQSQTLDRVFVNFESCLSFGQVYTALSRVRSLDGLYIQNLTYSHVKAHPKAVEFYKTLENNTN